MNKLKTPFVYFFGAVCMLLVSGCAPAIIAGSATGGVMANDVRTAGSFIEDEAIENKTIYQISREFGTRVHIGVVSYNRKVLLVGQAPTQEMKDKIIKIAENQLSVKKVYDRIDIASPSSLATRISDTSVTGKVKFSLCSLQIPNFSCLNIKIVTENGIVYLLGLVTTETADIAVEKTRNIGGVQKVVKVFEYQ